MGSEGYNWRNRANGRAPLDAMHDTVCDDEIVVTVLDNLQGCPRIAQLIYLVPAYQATGHGCSGSPVHRLVQEYGLASGLGSAPRSGRVISSERHDEQRRHLVYRWGDLKLSRCDFPGTVLTCP
jgi:hypothetical protein